jgi:hypothetical protein
VVASDGTYTDKVQVTWDSSAGTTFYEVYRAESADGAKTLLGSPTGPSWDDTTAGVGTIYYYWVKACNTWGCSNDSDYDTGHRSEVPPLEPYVTDSTAFASYAGSTYTYLVGHVQNPMAERAGFVRIYASFYDDHGGLVKEDYAFSCFPSLAPGMKSPFVMIVSQLPLSSWATYSLRLEWLDLGGSPVALEVSNESPFFDSGDAFHVTGTARNPFGQRLEDNTACVAMLDSTGNAIGVWWENLDNLEPGASVDFDVAVSFWKYKPDRNQVAGHSLQVYAQYGFPPASADGKLREDVRVKTDQLRRHLEADTKGQEEPTRIR